MKLLHQKSVQYQECVLTFLDMKINSKSSILFYIWYSIFVHGYYFQDFEQVVLETALENVASKYSRHLEIIKPALEMLLQQVTETGPRHDWLRHLYCVPCARWRPTPRPTDYGVCSPSRKAWPSSNRMLSLSARWALWAGSIHAMWIILNIYYLHICFPYLTPPSLLISSEKAR